MEKVIDFDEWFLNFKPPEIKYVAVYDPYTGDVKSVGPESAFENEEYKISVESETAEMIINDEIKIHNCFVDVNSNTLEIAEIKNIVTIDDVLHRITDVRYAMQEMVDKPNIYLTYTSKNKTLKIQMSEEFGGTKKLKKAVKQRKIIWDGETEMNFFITEYNDPNLIFKMFSVKINDLLGKHVIIKDIEYDKFSVYTRRLFKNYVIEYK